MKYSALEVARAAGLFVVVDGAEPGLRVVDGVAFVGSGASHDELASIAARMALGDDAQATVEALGFVYVE
jgi:hypothetical protein